ncbi:MAG TPA: DUF559 domain-containing protein [Ilumatobacteraceae bacterium]|nr:DUF559 domain-containing protein [Ilumatobacteraceae bacterium]
MKRQFSLNHDHVAALRGLVADIGEPCWVSGPTAAALHQLDGFELRPPFHLITARDRNVRRIGHVIHTTTDLPLIDRDSQHDLPILSATRTLIDIAWATTPERLTIALDSALRDGMTSEDFVFRRIVALRTAGRAGLTKLLAVLEGAEIVRGGQSWLEREVLRLLRQAGLPRPTTQTVLGRRGDKLIRVDFVFPGTPVVVEALGYRWHRTGAQMRIDTERVNALIAGGFMPLQFTYAQIVEAPDTVVASIRDTLELARLRLS